MKFSFLFSQTSILILSRFVVAAQTLNIPATILMPTFAPSIKVENVKRLGATVILHGNDFDEAKQEMYRLAAERGLVVIPPFDDPYVCNMIQ